MISDLNQEKQNIQTALRERVKITQAADPALYSTYKQLDADLKEYRNKLRRRVEEFEVLKSKEAALCGGKSIQFAFMTSNLIFSQFVELDEPSVLVKIKHLPSTDELYDFKGRIEGLERAKLTRTREILSLRDEVETLAKLLGNAEALELLSAEVQPTKLQMILIQKKLSQLKLDYKNFKISIQKNVQHLEELWKDLEIAEPDRQIDIDSLIYDPETAKKIENEIERLEKIKVAKLPELIEKLQIDIVRMMEKCQKGAKYRNHSAAFRVQHYDDQLMCELNKELKTLIEFYEENAEILTLIADRKAAKSELEGINSKQLDLKDRMKNRGGHLLREEQAKKAIEKKIFRIESKLSKALEVYAKRTNSMFMVNDSPFILKPPALKKQMSSSDLKLKKPLVDRTNV